MSPRLEFSHEESKSIEELRRRLKNDMKSEMYDDKMVFYRFLKARDFNINHAEIMLRKHLKWRKEKGIDTILKDYRPKEVLEKYLPVSFIGYDKEGCIVRYLSFGAADIKGMYLSAKYADVERRLFFDMECDLASLEKQTRTLGRIVDKCIYIHNFEGLTFAQVSNRRWIEDTMSYCRTYQNNYPERLKAVIAINGNKANHSISPHDEEQNVCASKYFQFGFSIVKTCLAGTVVEKIQVFGTDGWKEELLKYIDAEQLPAFLGGKKTDPDGNPQCKTFINHGGIIPERYYFHKSKRPLAATSGANKVVLSRNSFHEETILVEESGSLIEWEFETKAHDVGFGLFLRKTISEEDTMKEIVPIQRTDTKEFAETGIYKCEEPGKYIMVFDNTYSWMRSKEIFFRISVKRPNEERNIENT